MYNPDKLLRRHHDRVTWFLTITCPLLEEFNLFPGDVMQNLYDASQDHKLSIYFNTGFTTHDISIVPLLSIVNPHQLLVVSLRFIKIKKP